MLIALLLGAALLWATFGTAGFKDRKHWPAIGATLLGLVLLAKGRPFVGLALIGGSLLWTRRPQRKRPPVAGKFEDEFARAEARDLLGISVSADRETIIAAHRRLITRNHPDNGGTEGLAARLNAARDLLLKYHRP